MKKMRQMKRMISIMMAAMMLGILAIGTVDMEVKASDEETCIDGSYLTDEEASEGIIDSLTWGIYLKSGSSLISDAGSGKITVTGSTVAQKTVSKVAVYVRVQRLLDSKWASYTSWSASATNDYYVRTTKTISVDKGYYYRVYCTHVAESDSSSSSTNGIYID